MLVHMHMCELHTVKLVTIVAMGVLTRTCIVFAVYPYNLHVV